MEIIVSGTEKNLVANIETTIRPDVAWENNISDYEQETLESLINPALNYETIRFSNEFYQSDNSITQNDIWFYFYFYNNVNTYTGGLNYEYAGLSITENAKLTINISESFFRLDFYKVPSGETPTNLNRRMVFTKNLRIPLGEKVYYIGSGSTGNAEKINEYIYVPVFNGSNVKNEENMYIFWFMDDTVLEDTGLTGDTFYMTAKYFNSIDGSITNFGNKTFGISDIIDESTDFYFKLIINKTAQTYTITTLADVRIGDINNPIKFYEMPI